MELFKVAIILISAVAIGLLIAAFVRSLKEELFWRVLQELPAERVGLEISYEADHGPYFVETPNVVTLRVSLDGEKQKYVVKFRKHVERRARPLMAAGHRIAGAPDWLILKN